MNRSAKDRIRSSPHYGHAFTRRTKAFAGGTIGNLCVAQGPVGVMVLNRVSGSISESEMGSDAPPGSETAIVRQVVLRS